jgi:hypothetical protein
VGLRDIQSLCQILLKEFYEDINMSLNLGAGAFLLYINIMLLCHPNMMNLPIWIIMGENTALMYRIIS